MSPPIPDAPAMPVRWWRCRHRVPPGVICAAAASRTAPAASSATTAGPPRRHLPALRRAEPHDARFCASCGHTLARPMRRRPGPDPGPRPRPSGASSPSSSPTSWLHDLRRGPRPGGGPRAPDAYFETATRDHRASRRHRREVHRRRGHGRLGHARPPTRTTPSAPSAPRSSSSTRSSALQPEPPGAGGRPDRRGGGHPRRHEPGHGRRRPRQHRGPPAGVAAAGHRPRRRGHATRGASGDRLRAAGDHSLKGKASPVPAWRALRVVAQRGGQGRADVLEPPFVGREEELRQLKDALHAVGRERRPRLVSITGPGRHRQEPAGLGAREVHRRRRREHLLASRPLAVLRRGHHLLGARRDGAPPAGWPRTTTRPTTRERSRPPSPSTCPTRRARADRCRRC